MPRLPNICLPVLALLLLLVACNVIAYGQSPEGQAEAGVYLEGRTGIYPLAWCQVGRGDG